MIIPLPYDRTDKTLATIASILALAALILMISALPCFSAEDGARIYHPMTITDLASSAPGADIPTHIDIAGLVTLSKHEADGDHHLRICEDAFCKFFLVAECPPFLSAPCLNVRKGQWVRIKGISRYDGHHKWHEIHPIESLEILP